MSATTSPIKFLIIFEDEIRDAAKALSRAFSMTEKTPHEEFRSAAIEAMQACKVALDGAENDAAVLLLGRKPTVAS